MKPTAEKCVDGGKHATKALGPLGNSDTHHLAWCKHCGLIGARSNRTGEMSGITIPTCHKEAEDEPETPEV